MAGGSLGCILNVFHNEATAVSVWNGIIVAEEYDVILLDMNFKAGITSGNEGIFWMNRIQSLAPQTQVVLQTAYSDIELAVRSIKEGAVDFLAKPWDKEKLVTTVLNAYNLACSRKENRDLKKRQRELHKQ